VIVIAFDLIVRTYHGFEIWNDDSDFVCDHEVIVIDGCFHDYDRLQFVFRLLVPVEHELVVA